MSIRPEVQEDTLDDVDAYLSDILRVPVDSIGMDTKVRILLEEAQKDDSTDNRSLDDVTHGVTDDVQGRTQHSNRQT